MAKNHTAVFLYKGKKITTINTIAVTVCRKTSCISKSGVAGAEPPTGSRGGSPSKIAPSHGEGVWG